MSEGANILLVDDEPGMLRYIRTLLEVDDHKVQTASTGEEAVACVQKGLQPDLVLLDLLMPGIDGLQTLEQLRHLKPGLKVVMLSCVNDTRKVVQAMRLGAIDYLTKPFQKAELDAVIGQCVGTAKGESYAGEIEELCDDVFFVAASPAMKKIRSQAALVANVDIPVLLLGESGTGKEVLARLIHKLSPRAHRTFLKVNCAAVPATHTNAAANIGSIARITNNVTASCLTVQMLPALTKAFVPTTVGVGQASTLTFTITNPAATPARTNLTFIDALPAAVVIAAVPNVMVPPEIVARVS